MADYYLMLGVPRDATIETIRRAYRAHAKRLHPDHAGCDRAMAQLSRVYETLSDPAARSAYDRRLAGPSQAAPRRASVRARVFHPPAVLPAEAERFLHATLLPLDRLLGVGLRRLEAASALLEARPDAEAAAADLATALAQADEVLATTASRLSRATWPEALGVTCARYGEGLRLISDALLDLREDLAAGRGPGREGRRTLADGRGALARATAAAWQPGA